MNLFHTRQTTGIVSASDPRPVILEVVAEMDARADLTGAVDIQHGLGHSCKVHLLRFGRAGAATVPSDDAHYLTLDDDAGAPELAALLEDLQPDIVHTHRPRDLASVGAAAKAAGIPGLLHSMCGEVATAQGWQIEQFRALASDLRPLIVAPTAEAACALNPDTRVAVVPRGIDPVRYAPGEPARARRKIGLPPEPRVIGCASPAADLEILFQSLFRLEDDVHLALFGPAVPGPVERSLIRRLGIEERVHVLGVWALPELIHQAIDIYFHGPSRDCSPRPLLAAQACEKPVVATLPTLAETLCPVTGHLVPAQFQPAVVGALKRALSCSPAPAARGFIENNWSNAATLAGYNAIFQSVGPSAAEQRYKPNGSAAAGPAS